MLLDRKLVRSISSHQFTGVDFLKAHFHINFVSGSGPTRIEGIADDVMSVADTFVQSKDSNVIIDAPSKAEDFSPGEKRCNSNPNSRLTRMMTLYLISPFL